MATKEELFISYPGGSYLSGKSNVLMSQADSLSTLKRLHNLKVLARQKHDLKKRLHKLFTSTLSDIDSIQDKMPTPKVPKTVKPEEPKEKIKESFPKRDDIEEELKSIQEKLQQLTS